MMTTVLPTPAPPNRPILPPFTNGAIRSTTLMPVSKISVFGSRLTKSGRLRWIGQRSVSFGIGAPLSTGSPSTLRMRPSAGGANGHRDRAAGVDDFHAAHHGVGRRHGDRAHLVAADVLLHFDGRRGSVEPSRRRARDLERVVELRQMLRLELDVEHRADDLNDLADVVNAVAVAMGSNAVASIVLLDRLPYPECRRAADDLGDLLRDVA